MNMKGPYLAVVTDSKLIGYGPSGEKIFNALRLEILPICSTSSGSLTPGEQRDEKQYIKMLKSVINGHRNAFYFSFDYPLTMSAQRLNKYTTAQGPTPFWQKSDESFFWNRKIMTDFVTKRLHQWIYPVINGFVKVSIAALFES